MLKPINPPGPSIPGISQAMLVEGGRLLFLSEETVKSHVRHLLAKLQARSRAHAVAVGFRRGLLT